MVQQSRSVATRTTRCTVLVANTQLSNSTAKECKVAECSKKTTKSRKNNAIVHDTNRT